MFGLEHDDFKDDFSCFPLERMIGVEGVRGIDADCGGEGESLRLVMKFNGDGSGDDVGNGTEAEEDAALGTAGADMGGKSMWEGGSTEGENLPDSLANLKELSWGYPPPLLKRRLRGCAGEGTLKGASSSSSLLLCWSSGGESSGLRWKTALRVAEGRRFGNAPRDTNAPGPRSSENEERVRRC